MSPLSGPVIIDYLASLGFAVPLKESCVIVPHSPQVYDVFPALEPLYFQFEKDFDPTCLPDLYEMYWYGSALSFLPSFLLSFFPPSWVSLAFFSSPDGSPPLPVSLSRISSFKGGGGCHDLPLFRTDLTIHINPHITPHIPQP
jgi:hypothetical protein